MKPCLDAIDARLDICNNVLHALDLSKCANVHLIIELTALFGARALPVLADQQESRDEYRFDRENDSEEPERIGVEHRSQHHDAGIDANPQEKPESVDNDEVRIADERHYTVGDSLVSASLTSDLLFCVTKVPERFVTRRVSAKNGVRRVLSAALRADYQMRARVLALRTIGSPSLQPNALANSGMFESGPFTRNLPGECGSV